MFPHLVAFVIVLAPIPPAAKNSNPFQLAKVGDYATFNCTLSIMGTPPLLTTVTYTVTSKTEKEVSIRITGTANGKEIPPQERKLDLTKTFDPSKLIMAHGFEDVKVEIVKQGVEKLKLDGKERETAWTTYKVTGKVNVELIELDVKLWVSKDVPGVLAGMEYTLHFAGTKSEVKAELTETGKKQ